MNYRLLIIGLILVLVALLIVGVIKEDLHFLRIKKIFFKATLSIKGWQSVHLAKSRYFLHCLMTLKQFFDA
ncbi:hypothetical protein ACR3IL_08140 [Streptococcus iniae]